MTHVDKSMRERIRELNDEFRKNSNPNLGGVVLTIGVSALPANIRTKAINLTTEFDAFNEDNDPHGEHDFGEFEIDNHRFFWKIDYYDLALQMGSDDPADVQKTRRVLTLMLAEEY